MPETLQDKVSQMVATQYPETHYPEGGTDFDKVTEKVNSLTNDELLVLISEALVEMNMTR